MAVTQMNVQIMTAVKIKDVQLKKKFHIAICAKKIVKKDC